MYFGWYRSVEKLAGHQTQANVLVQFLSSEKVFCLLAAFTGGAGIAYGVRQKRLRRRTIDHLAPIKAENEQRSDPNRESSDFDEFMIEEEDEQNG